MEKETNTHIRRKRTSYMELGTEMGHTRIYTRRKAFYITGKGRGRGREVRKRKGILLGTDWKGGADGVRGVKGFQETTQLRERSRGRNWGGTTTRGFHHQTLSLSLSDNPTVLGFPRLFPNIRLIQEGSKTHRE